MTLDSSVSADFSYIPSRSLSWRETEQESLCPDPALLLLGSFLHPLHCEISRDAFLILLFFYKVYTATLLNDQQGSLTCSHLSCWCPLTSPIAFWGSCPIVAALSKHPAS